MAYLPLLLRRAKDGEVVDAIWWDVYNWGITSSQELVLKASLQGLFEDSKAERLDTKTVQALYLKGKALSGSVTRFETYRSCPYKYFLQYGLQLEERKQYIF